jgi:hypothetical protein
MSELIRKKQEFDNLMGKRRGDGGEMENGGRK